MTSIITNFFGTGVPS